MAKITVQVRDTDIIVGIDKIPHLILRRADLTAVSSWINWPDETKVLYFIEFTTKNGPVVLDYTSKILWETILKELAKANLFGLMPYEEKRC